MKKHPEKYWLGAMLALLVILLVGLTSKLVSEKEVGVSRFFQQKSTYNFQPKAVAEKKQVKRATITFIMGEDKDDSNFYYTEAANYYRLNDDALESGHLVTHCRSLEEVKEYLAANRVNDQVWGRINMVLHSNEWSGLGVPLYPGGPRATTASIVEALEADDIQPLSRQVVDHQSELILYGCGLGRNELALKAVALAFGEEEFAPVVRSTRYFVYYESKRYLGQPVASQQYLADYWYAFYKTGYRPGDIKLSRQLKGRYPDELLDWRAALRREEPRWLGDTYHHTFRVPVVWWVTYPTKEERPDLSTSAAQQEWLVAQPELQSVIENYNIPEEYFQWTFRETSYTFEDGTTEPAIKAIGFSTILCVLKALTVPVEGDGGAMALEPALTDTLYYAVAKGF